MVERSPSGTVVASHDRVSARVRQPGLSRKQPTPTTIASFYCTASAAFFPNSTPGERIEITAKIGRAYGFTVENSYLRNPRNGRAVFVTAVLYTNTDGILNDDKYDYATVADPFFADWASLLPASGSYRCSLKPSVGSEIASRRRLIRARQKISPFARGSDISCPCYQG